MTVGPYLLTRDEVPDPRSGYVSHGEWHDNAKWQQPRYYFWRQIIAHLSEL